jgi:SAM-dependent methyltransferase
MLRMRFNTFSMSPVLWPELINSWHLSSNEIDYINRKQGFHCTKCSNNLRSMGLAAAIMREFSFQGTFTQFCGEINNLDVLEINRAGNLTPTLSTLSGHKLIEYPQFDMLDLKIESDTKDLVLHSDTLEHIPDPIRGLAECLRVLRPSGKCIFTVPLIVDRLSRSRAGLAPSYHGQSSVNDDDQVVYSEFGVDI